MVNHLDWPKEKKVGFSNMRRMTVVYVAGKYRGRTHCGKSYTEIHRNILTAREWAIKVNELESVIALTPHLNSYHMELDGRQDPEFWYNADLELLRRCDAVFLIPNWTDSQGARLEKEFAESINIPTFTDFGRLAEWLRCQSLQDEAAQSSVSHE